MNVCQSKMFNKNKFLQEDITLEGVQELLHAVLCVLEIDLFNFVSEKSSPVLLSPTEQLPLLRNRFTKEILSNNKQKKTPLPPICDAPSKNFETHFISDEMLEDVPFNQVIFKVKLSWDNYSWRRNVRGYPILKRSFFELTFLHYYLYIGNICIITILLYILL